MTAAVFVCMLTLLFSCGGSGGDSESTPGESGTITLSTSATTLPADNSSSCIITATILDGSGSPVRHYTDVTFTTTLGRFRNGSTSYTVKTQPPLGSDGLPNPDASPTGMAQVALISGWTSGSAKVTVSSNGVTQSIYVSITGTAGNITLTASPATMPADGVTSSTVTATVTDSSGTGVTPGTPVTFKTGLGLFQNGQKTYTITTPGSTGTVSVSLIAGVVPGITYVEASANGITQAVSISLTRTDPVRSEINVDADPLRIAADGQSSSIVTATVSSIPGATASANAAGTPISGVPVTFYDATSSATPDPLPTNNTWTGTGTSLFVVPAFYANGSITFTITYVGAETSNFAVVLWKIDADPNVKKFLINTTGPVSGQSVTYTLTSGNYQFQILSDGYWEIKVDGNVSTATTTEPIVLAITETDSNGKARYAYTSSTTPGLVTIKAETGEVSNSANALSGTVDITETEGPPSRVDVKATPPSIYANGENEIIIEADVWDENGDPAPNGAVVSFSATTGTLKETSVTTVSGKASTTLIAVAGAANVESTVTATSGGYADATVVTFMGVSLSDMQATPVAIFANGTDTSEITVRLKDQSGAAVVGETIVFNADKGTLGLLSTVTDADGLAKTTLMAPTVTGKATIKAVYGTLTTNTNVSFEAVGAGSITLAANPITIPADGTSSATITATVTYSSGAAVPKGTSVTFATNLGKFSNGAQTYTIITPDDTGSVSVSLISATTPGSAKVTASAINTSQTVYVGMGGAPISITLEAVPTSIPADGASSSTITATLIDGAGKPVTPGTSVVFTTTLGTFSNKTNTITATTLDDKGTVSVALIAGKTPGAATVTATSSGVSHVVEVVFSGAPEVGSIVVSANPTSIPADGKSTSAITALVKTADNQVVEGASVSFITARGAITSPHITDANGQATATLTSERYVDTSVQITATCQGKEAYTFVAFTGVTLTLTAVPESLLVGDKDGSAITAKLTDAAGNPISNTAVTFTTDKGALTPPSPQITNSAGQAFVTLNSDESGTATVKGSALGAEGKVEVNFTRYAFNLSAIPTTIRVGGETSQITAELLDEGVPKSGQTVYFSTTLGTLSLYQKDTGTDGKATVALTSGVQSGKAIIDATTTIVTPATELSANTQVVITGGTAAKIVLTADPDIITTVTGVSTLTAAVYDANDQPAANQEIYFRINAGPGGGEYLSASVKTTDNSGLATVSFYAGSLPSALKGVEIEANTQSDFGGSFGLAILTIAGPVANIGIGMNLETLTPAGGSLEIDIAGIATDVNGNPVADGTKLYFAVTAVEFNEDRAHDFTIDCWDDNKNPLTPCPAKGTPGFGFTWFSDDVNQDGTMYTLGGPMSTTEDVNHNGILDPGEDKNDNGVIDPIQGCTINDSVETVNGVGEATLIYPAPQANNIRVRITAEAGGVSNFYETVLLCTQKMVDNGTCGIAY